MLKDRAVQDRKISIARHLIAHQMRASVIAAMLCIPLTRARGLYAEINGCPSPSGQKPQCDSFYFQPIMRLHASAFYCLYRHALKGLEPAAALAQAYDMYVNLCGGDGACLLSADRAWRLTVLAAQNDGRIREAACRQCGSFGLIQPHESITRYRCPACMGSLDVSERLRGKSGRKPKQPCSPQATVH